MVAILAVAASTGLTYAVVVLSKDYAVSNNVMISKYTGETLQTQSSEMHVGDSGALLSRQGTGTVGTSAVIREQGLDELLMQLSTTDPTDANNMDMIAQIQTITVPNGIQGAPYTVMHVAEAAPLSNGSLYIRSTGGSTVIFSPDGTAAVTEGGRRRLLAAAGQGTVRYALGTKDLPRGVNRRWDAWFTADGSTSCDPRKPVQGSDGKCAPCTSVVEAGQPCWSAIKGASSVVCASTGMCLDTRDRIYRTQNGLQVAGDNQCRYKMDFSKSTLIPTATPEGSDQFPCFPCYYKVDAGVSCWPNSDDSSYICQENGFCVQKTSRKTKAYGLQAR